MLVYGNAALGSKRSAHVGGVFATPECASGRAFQKFLADFHMALPSTFEHLHEGPSATFTLPNGAQSRKDVVAAPRSQLESVSSSYMDDTFVLTVTRDDHLPVVCDVSFAITCQAKRDSAPRFSFQRTALHNPLMVSQIAERLDAIPLIPWHVDGHTHAHLLTKQVQEVFADVAPTNISVPRAPWMTSKCWEIRRDVIGQRRHSAKCFKIIKRNYFRLVFYSWKAVQSTLPLHCKYDILVRLDDDFAYSAITRVHAFSNALRAKDNLNVLYPKLRKHLIDDRTVHYNRLATSLYNAVSDGRQAE